VLLTSRIKALSLENSGVSSHSPKLKDSNPDHEILKVRYPKNLLFLGGVEIPYRDWVRSVAQETRCCQEIGVGVLLGVNALL
jgi:hypothetical protein